MCAGKKKFTLIELLTVIPVTGILVSLLMISLGSTREKAKTTVCVSNQFQINKALQMYLSSEDSRMPYDPNVQRDTWPSFLDPFAGGGEFQGASAEAKTDQSKIWSACPNSFITADPPRFRDSDYAGVFPQSSRWFTSGIDIISDPANSVIFTEGNHESAWNPSLGNSWIRVGAGAKDSEYNNITGISWDHVRHEFGKVFTMSSFDGAARSTKWINLNTFSSNFGIWVNTY